MTIRRKSGGAWQFANVNARIGGSGFIGRVTRVRESGSWRQVWPFQLYGTANPSGYRVAPGAGTVTASPNLSIEGGSGNYSYSTVKLSGAAQVSAANPAALGAYAQATMSGILTYVASFRTTATDNATGQTTTFDWTATLQNEA